jgi:putative copper export protein
VALVAQLASLSFDGATAVTVMGSGFGRLLGLRLAAAVLLWAVLALDAFWPVLALGAGVALIDGATAHAIAGLPGAGLLLSAAHVASMGLWVGALVGFVVSSPARGEGQAEIFPSPARGGGQGGGIALGAFAVTVVTGLLLALAHVGFPPALTTGYGWALAAKIVVVGMAVVMALLSRRRAELAAVAIILAAAAILVSLPPPQ